MVSSFTLNLRKEAIRGRKVILTSRSVTTDTSGRPVSVSETTETEVDGNISVISYEQLREKRYGDMKPGDAIGRFLPNTVNVGDIVQEVRSGNTDKYRVYLLLNKPKNELGEVVIERFALKRIDNI